MNILKKRSDFLKTAKGRKIVSRGFILQTIKRKTDPFDETRIGFTASKKVGNAVMRNRAKRRMRELARLHITMKSRSDHDYVMIARNHILDMDFEQLVKDSQFAIRKIHQQTNKSKS